MASACVFHLNHSLGNKQWTVKNPRVLKTAVCSVGEEQQCGPPASVIKTAGLASAGRRASPLAALKVMLACVFYFSLIFIVLRTKITGWLYFCMQSFFSKFCWWVVLDGWVADATVEETVLLEFVLHRHVFLCVSCFLMPLPASPGPTHNMI